MRRRVGTRDPEEAEDTELEEVLKEADEVLKRRQSPANPPKKSLGMAYFLWGIAPPLGLHHLYLGSGSRALRHASWLGLGGAGWLCDALLMPLYCRPKGFSPPAFVFWMRVLLFTCLYTALFSTFFPREDEGWQGIDWPQSIAMGTVVASRPLGAAFGAWLATEPLQCGSLVRAAVLSAPLSAGATFLVGETAQFSNRSAIPNLAAVGGAVGGIYWHRSRADTIVTAMPTAAAAHPAKSVFVLVTALSTWAVQLLGVYQHSYIYSYAKGEYQTTLLRVNKLLFNQEERDEFYGRLDKARDAFYSALQGGGGGGGSVYFEAVYRAIEAYDRTGELAACKTLGVVKGEWTMSSLKKVHRGLARKLHPDKLMGSTPAERAQAERRFKEIQTAYELLVRIHRLRSPPLPADEQPSASTGAEEDHATIVHDED